MRSTNLISILYDDNKENNKNNLIFKQKNVYNIKTDLWYKELKVLTFT